MRATNHGSFRALHVPQRHSDPAIKPRWFRFTDEQSRLEVLDGSIGPRDAVLEQVWRLPRSESDFVTVVVPELFRRRSLFQQIRRPFELLLKLRLISEPGVVVADVPTIAGADGPPPERAVVRILVSGVNAVSMRAVNYAQTLGIADTSALHFAFSAEEAPRIKKPVAPTTDRGCPSRSTRRRIATSARRSCAICASSPRIRRHA